MTVPATSRKCAVWRYWSKVPGATERIHTGRFGDTRLPGSHLQPEQQRAALTILWSQDRFVGVQGYAGTGKTALLATVRKEAEQAGYLVRGMAVSASATQVLQQETGIASVTVARFAQQQMAREPGQRHLGKELWVVDEASFLSQKDALLVMRAAEVRGAKVALIGDVRQLPGVQAGKPFEVAQRQGMLTATLTTIYRQKTSALREAVQAIIAGRSRDALQKLPVVEIRDARALLDRIVQDIAAKTPAERQGLCVITATNRDRQAINDGVRQALQAQGEIRGAVARSAVLVSKGWTAAQRQTASWYQPGDVVRFGRDYPRLGMDKDDYAQVASVNAQSGTVYVTTETGRMVAWKPAQLTRVEVYTTERRDLQAGDTIRFTRNTSEVVNGQTASVERLQDGLATLRLSNGTALTLALADNQHWDYGYASTIHASQGKTVDTAAVHITPGSGQAFGERSFYVAATRARQDTTIYTTDREAAASLVTQPQDKTSALEALDSTRQANAQDATRDKPPNVAREERAHDKQQERQARRGRDAAR